MIRFLQRTENCPIGANRAGNGPAALFAGLVVLFIFAKIAVTGQQIRFDQLGIADGLSSNTVYTIKQDSYGILWFGTLDGLDRYDGYSVTNFRHDSREGSLPNNRTTLIYEDHSHTMWLYDEFTSTIVRYQPDKETFKAYHLDKVVGSALEISSVFEGFNGTLFVSSRLGYTLRYNMAQDMFEMESHSMSAPPDYNKNYGSMLQSLDLFLKQSGSAYTTRTIGVRKVLHDSQGLYWIGTKYGGLFSATVNNGAFSFTSHLTTGDPLQVIPSEEIHDIYEDRSQVIWVGTRNNGVYRYSPHRYKFNLIRHVVTPNGVVPLGTLRAIVEDSSKNIWVGTNEHGVIRIDPSGKTGKHYNPKSAGHRFIRSLWIDERQTLWIGHYNGFSKYQPKSDNFKTYYPKPGQNEEVRIYDFKSDHQRGFWMAGWDLILHFDPATEQYETISRLTLDDGFTIENIRDVEISPDGKLAMAAGEKGIALYNAVEGTFTTIHYSPSNPKGLPSENILDVHLDHKNRIWLATADGLCQFDPNNFTCEKYGVNEGLPANLIYGLLEDDEGNFWFSSTRGLGRFDPRSKTFENYDVEDGLQSNEFSENAFYKSPSGRMYFGGLNGLNFFDPAKVPENKIAPQVAITMLKVFDQPLAETVVLGEKDIRKNINSGEAIRLSPEQRSVSFEFVALHYVNPGKNRCAYMLEGFDADWTERDASIRFANYTNLEPGTYHFRVKAANSDGTWSEPTQVTITIDKPYYATTWFQLTVISLLTGIGIIAYRLRIAALKKQQGLKAIQLETELNFLKSQVNPHFLFNTLNNIYALCQVNSQNAAPMVGKVSEMMRYMLYDCKEDRVPLEKEIEYLRNYIDLNQLKSPRPLNATLKITGDTRHVKLPPLLLINFLENGFKHGDLNFNTKGFVTAELEIKGDTIRFVVRNSYQKQSQEAVQGGIGLENVRHRLELLYPGRYTLAIKTENGIFEIDLSINHL